MTSALKKQTVKTNRVRPTSKTEPLDAAWEASLRFLRQFAARQGHARVDVHHMEGTFRLGQWVKIQRSRRAELTLRQRDALSSLPGWVWDDSPRTSWQDHYDALDAFARENGHTHVPLNYYTEGLRLGFWIAEQRLSYSQGDLFPDRIDALERIPGWTWSSISPCLVVATPSTKPTPLSWERGYDLLRSFVAREGHARVPANHLENSIKLGQWVRDQRARRHKLPPTKIRALERLPGWTWQAWAERWQRGLSHLQAYVEREGTACVPVAHIESDYKLGVWVRAQRMRKIGLSPEQIAALECLPGWAWRAGKSNDEWWRLGYEALLRFSQSHGHCDVPFVQRDDGFCLGRWVRMQRRKYLSGELSTEKAELLSKLPCWNTAKRRQRRSLEGKKS
jgi:hypothetical protein